MTNWHQWRSVLARLKEFGEELRGRRIGQSAQDHARRVVVHDGRCSRSPAGLQLGEVLQHRDQRDVEAADGRAVIRLDPQPVHLNHNGTVNAPILYALAEVAGAGAVVAGMLELAALSYTVVKRAEIDYLAPARGAVVATGQIPPASLARASSTKLLKLWPPLTHRLFSSTTISPLRSSATSNPGYPAMSSTVPSLFSTSSPAMPRPAKVSCR